ncbi:MAG: hypothetical protein JKX98_12290 [Alcanivoracaceae bacterium]|nr:hypothetical protein [Alcanivoracaceae bacterium]
MQKFFILMILNLYMHSSFGSGSTELKTHTLSVGGGDMSGGIYSITTSIGQLDAGHQAAGGSYVFNGGILAKPDRDQIFDDGFEG